MTQILTSPSKYKELVHFSINGMSEAFKWIYMNEPESIFCEPRMECIKQWHEVYGVSFDLYLYEINDSFSISDVQDKYWKEIEKNSSWLKIGWYHYTKNCDQVAIDSKLSIKRVFKLIEQNASTRALSKTARLLGCKGTKEIIDELVSCGVTYLFTDTIIDRASYDLSENENQLLQKRGYLRRGNKGIVYKITDIDFDVIPNELNDCELLNMASKAYDKYAYRKAIEVCISEDAFEEKKTKITVLLGGLESISKELYINTGVIYDNKLYYTAANSNYLYALDIASEDSKPIAYYPGEGTGMKFSSLVAYNHKIWMIPWVEKHIFVYDILQDEMITIEIPNQMGVEENNTYRKAIAEGKFLWVIPTVHKCIMKIDMDNYDIKFLDGFPDEVSFDQEKKMLFKCMNLYGKELFLFADSCSHNIVVDTNTDEIRIWNDDFSGEFGIKIDENNTFIAPQKDQDNMRIYKESGEIYAVKSLKKSVWNHANLYAFWYCQKIGDSVYALPHEANVILQVNCNAKLVETIDISDEDVRNAYDNNYTTIYDVYSFHGGLLASPGAGNKLLQINNGIVEKKISLKAPLLSFVNSMKSKDSVEQESLFNSLDGYLKRMTSTKHIDKCLECIV